MEDSLKEAVAQYADANDLTVSQVIRKALVEFLNKNKN
jgi:predicted transcriptional regulator